MPDPAATTHAARPPGARPPLRPIGALLVLLGVVVAFVSLTMTWNPENTFAGADYSSFAYANALQQDPAWATTGVMLTAGLILVVVSAIVALVGSAVHLLTRASVKPLGWVVLGFAIAGFVASAATLIVSLIMEGAEVQQPGLWIFGLSFIPVVVGAVGIAIRRY